MDAYDTIYSAMRAAGAQAAAEGAVRLRLGEILSVSPLKLDVAGTVQEAERVRLTRAGTGLEPGNMVLLLTDDDQTFYLIDKVVQAT